MCLIAVFCDDIFISLFLFFFFKQKTAYEMRISDWSSDVCSSDLSPGIHAQGGFPIEQTERRPPCPRLQAPANVRDRIGLGVIECSHVVAQELCVETARNLRHVAIFNSEPHWNGKISLPWKQASPPVPDDGALTYRFVRPAGQDRESGV